MPRYYEFDVSLQGINPRIWRRFLLRTTSTFVHLHQAIQQSLGWQDYHLWEFGLPGYKGRRIAGHPFEDPSMPDAKLIKLNTYFTGKQVVEWCEYLYDFGDDWIHDVKLMAVHSKKESFKRRLLGGERAGPPEDSGGPHGYQRMVRFLETGEDPHGEDPRHLRNWLGDWRPDVFDLPKAKAEFDR